MNKEKYIPITIFYNKNKSDDTLKSFVNSGLGKLKMLNRKMEIIDFKSTTLSGLSAIRVICTLDFSDDDVQNITTLYLVWMKGDISNYHISCICNKNLFEIYKETIDSVVNSIQVKIH